MKRARLLLSLVLISIQAPTSAQGVDPASGNYWIELCKQSDRTACLSFILGLREANSYDSYVRKIPQYCLPVGATIEQMRKVVLKFSEDNPNLLHIPFGMLSITAFQQKFPCS
jgi:hypothetical protein